MSRDPLRERPTPPGEQRGKHDTQEAEDRGAGRRPDELISGDAEVPSRLPGLPEQGDAGLPVPVDGEDRRSQP